MGPHSVALVFVLFYLVGSSWGQYGGGDGGGYGGGGGGGYNSYGGGGGGGGYGKDFHEGNYLITWGVVLLITEFLDKVVVEVVMDPHKISSTDPRKISSTDLPLTSSSMDHRLINTVVVGVAVGDRTKPRNSRDVSLADFFCIENLGNLQDFIVKICRIFFP